MAKMIQTISKTSGIPASRNISKIVLVGEEATRIAVGPSAPPMAFYAADHPEVYSQFFPA